MSEYSKTKEELIAELEELKQKYVTLESKYAAETAKQNQEKKALRDGKVEATPDSKSPKLLEQIKQCDTLYEALFTKSHLVKLLIDPETGDIEDANETACNYYGCSHDELCQKNISQLNTLSDNEVKAEMQKAGKKSQNHFFFKHKLANGEVREVEVYSGPIQYAGTTLLYSLIHDITDQKRLEFNLNERMKELNCHNRISEVMSNNTLSVEEVCEEIVRIIPEGWQFPEITGACIQIAGSTYRTTNYKEGEHLLYQDITIHGKVGGHVKVCLPDDQLPVADHLFLPEESDLLFSIAERIGNFVEKKQYDAIIAESEEKYSKAFQTSPYAISIARVSDGKFIEVNDALIKITGFSREEILNTLNSHDLWLKAEDRNEVIEDLKQGKKVLGREYQFKNKQGETVTGLFSAQFITLDNEAFLMSSINNITSIKQTELERQENETLYKAIINASPDNITITDLNGNILFVSPIALEMFGYHHNDELLNRNLMEFIADEDRERAQSEIISMVQGVFTGADVYKAIKADNSIIHIEVNGEFIRDEKGNPTRMIFVVRDVTTRIKAEEKLLESKQIIEGIINTIPARVFWKDRDLRYIGCNKAFAKDAGFTDINNVIGKDDFQLVWHKLAELFRRDDKEVIETGKQKISIEEKLKTADGNTISIITNKTPLLNANGEVIGMLGTYMDISERATMELDLKQSEEKFKALFYDSPDGYLIIRDGKFIECNKAAEKLIGGNRLQIIGCSPDQLSPEFQPNGINSVQYASDLIEETIKKGENSFDWLHKRFDGEEVLFRINLTVTTYEGQMVLFTTWHDITEQRKAEEKLRKISLAVEQSPVSIVIADIDGNIEYVNPKACKTTGYTAEELIGNNPRVLKSGETKKTEYDELWKKISTGKSWQGVFHNKRKNGQLYWESSTISPIFNNDGKITHYLAIKEDITEQRKIQMALQESETRFSQIAEQSKTVIWEVNHEGLCTYVNQLAENVLGFAPDELIGKKYFYDLHPEKGRDNFKHAALELFHRKEHFTDLPNQIVTKDNRTIWVSTNGVPVLDSQNNLLGYRGADNEITDKVEALEELRKFRTISDQANYGNAIADLNGNLIYSNDAFAQMHGYEVEEIVGHQLSMLHSEQQMIRVNETLDLLRKQGGFSAQEVWRTRKDGTIFPSLMNAKIIFDGENQPMYLSATTIDITELKNSQNKLEQSEADLNAAQEISLMCSWELDLMTEKLTWSKNYYHLMGIPAGSEMNTQFFLERVHPEDIHLVDEKVEEMKASKKPVTYDVRLRMPDNEYRWIQNNIVPEFMDDTMVRFKGVNIDITDKKIAEERIKSQNETLNAIIKAIPDLMFVIDKDGKYLEVFASESEKLLVSPDKIIGSNIDQVFSNEMAKIFLGKIRESISKNRTIVIDYAINLPNSPSTDFEARIVPIDQEKVLILSRDVTEKAIREKELKRLSTAVQQSPVITVITDLHANIEYVNPAFTSITGYSQEEVIGKNVRILKSGKTDRAIYKNLWETIRSGNQWHGEWMNKKKSGELYWENVLITPIRNDAGKVTNYLAVKQDITERKKAEQEIHDLNTNLEEKIKLRTNQLSEKNVALKNEIEVSKKLQEALHESEIKQSSMISNISDVIGIIGTDGLTKFESLNIEKYFGWQSKDLIGKRGLSRVHPDDLERIQAEFQSLIQKENETKTVEFRYQCKDGTYKPVELTATNLINDPVINGILLNYHDITERKQAEEELAIKTQRLASILEGTNVGTWEWNIQTGETVFNERWANIIGYTLDEISPVSIETWMKFAHPDDLKRSGELLEKHFSGELDYYSFESRMKHKNGDWIWVLDRGKVNKWDAEGKPLLMSGTHQVITEQKRAADFERELLQLSPTLTGLSLEKINDAIKQALSRIGEFLSADRSYIFEFDATVTKMSNTYEWCNKGINPEIENLQDVPCEILPRWMEMLHKHENIVIASVKDLPESWQAEREIIEPQGIQSLIVIPMLAEDKLIGFVGLDSVLERKEYNQSEINILQVWSSMLASLINNQRSEKLLEQTRQNYETFFNTIDEFLWVLDEQGNVIHTNNTVEERLEYAREELINQSVLMVHPAERRQETERIVREMLAGTATYCPVPIVSKSGKQIPVETRVKSGYWNGQAVIFGISKDITQIQLSEQKFSSAFQSNSAIMTITRFDDDQFVDVNNAFVNTLGYTREEIKDNTLVTLGIVRENAQYGTIQEAIERGIPVREIEIKAFSKSNEMFIFLLSAEEIHVGSERCILSVAVNITERKRMEDDLRQARIEAEQANLAKSEFLSRMSHELRTPMNSILGFSQLLEMTELNQNQSKGVQHILKSGKHLLNLINEVLDIARIESGRISLSLEPVQLKGVIIEVVDIIQPLANQQHITVELISSQVILKSIRADKQRFKQVLLNLLNNAIKYNRQDGSVVIKTIDLGEAVRILVSDTGMGISADNISKIFTPFERIGAEKTTTEGTGLGLAVVKKLMEAMGGKIGVDSVLNEGTTFWVEFPVTKNQNQLIENNQEELETDTGQNDMKGLILYIEDNSSNVELVEQILSNQLPGIRIISETNGKQGVKLASEFRPDLILLDLNLPDMHGSEVLELLQRNANTKHIPVIVVSADAMPHQIQKLLNTGAKDYLTKPLDVYSFLRAVERWLKKKGTNPNKNH